MELWVVDDMSMNPKVMVGMYACDKLDILSSYW